MDKNSSKARELTQKGIDLANLGKINDSIPFFKKSLSLYPTPDTYYLLALAYQMIGKTQPAEKNYKEAIRLFPKFSMAYNNLGAIYLEQKKFARAEEAFTSAVDCDPGNVFAHNNLGNAYKSRNKYLKAKKKYNDALKINPEFLESYNNLGIIAFEENQTDEAIRYFKKALEINAGYSPCLFHLSMAYIKKDETEKAVKTLVQYIDLVPDDDKAQSLLANLYLTKKEYEKSLTHFNRAIELNPKNTFAINDLGNLYKEIGSLEEAKKCYQKVIDLDPTMAGTFNNLGVIGLEQGNYEEAISQLKQALALKPDMSSAFYHLGLIYERQHKLDLAEKNFTSAINNQADNTQAQAILIYCLMQECKWKELSTQIKSLELLTKSELKDGKTTTESPFLNVIRDDNKERNFKIAVSHSLQIAKNIGEFSGFTFIPQKKKKIRIGYLSCDFFDHATVHLISGLFLNHDRDRFKVYVYSYGTNDGSIYQDKIASDSDVFRDITNSSYRDSAELIYNDKIDILVDLKGHTKNTRLEIDAYRPAPIQISYLGFPGTTGADFFDYILTDKMVTPLADQKYFTEKFAYLPYTYQVNNDKREIANIKYERATFGLPENRFVFSSFNHTYKIDPKTFSSWMSILKQVPNSVLWLLESNKFAPVNLMKEAKKYGITVNRLIFTPFTSNPKHLARIRLSDLALDPFICNGHTTTSDALWAGVPVITLQGKHFASRVASSILSAIELPELITYSTKQYEDLAVTLATKKEMLLDIKQKLAENKSTKPLFKTELFVRNLEKLYLTMWDNYIKGKHPEIIQLA